MKQILYFLSFTFATVTAWAQEKEFYMGGRLGLGESRIECAGIPNAKSKLAVSGGITTSYFFTKNLALNAEFLLTSAGARAQGSSPEKGLLGGDVYYSYKEKYDLVNAEVPITGQLTLWFGNMFLRGYTGPSMSFKLMAVQTRTYDDSDYNNSHGFINKQLDQTNNIFYSMVYGVGIGARSESNKLFFLDFRINRALTSMGNINNVTAFSSYYCLSAGYEFLKE
jgi:hypothetical protein